MLINNEVDVEVWLDAINTAYYFLNTVVMIQEGFFFENFSKH